MMNEDICIHRLGLDYVIKGILSDYEPVGSMCWVCQGLDKHCYNRITFGDISRIREEEAYKEPEDIL